MGKDEKTPPDGIPNYGQTHPRHIMIALDYAHDPLKPTRALILQNSLEGTATGTMLLRTYLIFTDLLGPVPASLDSFTISYVLNFTKSKYSVDEIYAYKSLEDYNCAASGWVPYIGVKSCENYKVVLAKRKMGQ